MLSHIRSAALVALALGANGCAAITVQQKPFEPLAISSDRPDAPPPRVILKPSRIQITEKVQFAFDSADILPVSHSLLDEIAKVLKDNEQIEELQVEGHTDAQGNAAYNKKLSQSRAESVRDYLVKAGVAKARLAPKGFGSEHLITDGTEEADHELNRRVEFNILKQGPKKVLVQD
jgi:outer membrane protein OmpA-like peptidoglycan-associated protein